MTTDTTPDTPLDRASWWRQDRPDEPPGVYWGPTHVGFTHPATDAEWLAQAFREAVGRAHESGITADPIGFGDTRHDSIEDPDYNCEHPFCVRWWPMVRAAEARAKAEVASPATGEGLRTTLYDTPEDIEAALGRLRGPVTRDEATVMAAAQAAADALRGGSIVQGRRLATTPDTPLDDERDDCTICGGEGYVECDDPIQCLDPHVIDNDTDRCRACGGSGRAEDQTVW